MALGAVLLPAILVLVVFAACAAIAFFMPEEKRTGCLLVSGALFLLWALTLVAFLTEAGSP
ncbi:hypothetical protein SIN09_30125 [Streptomyces sp. F8]|uniref:hypothetical protein n=1 Tax=Streptomyces sp. F8 TaxID=1436085 RepID=UPI0029CACF46|nr:hypothetical protein [Streptomyces sp. F8]MDX6763544.1 hypothetical protein [Streptomyces sp. F8]